MRNFIVFGETREFEEELCYLYEVQGSAAYMDIYVTDMQQHGWAGSCTLQDLKEMVTDISPDETQMLDWIVTAAKSNKFSLVHKGGLAHLEAKIAAGGFTIDIRLPPEDDLVEARADMEPRNFDLARSLLEHHQQQDKELAKKETEAHASQSKVEELQEQVHQLESRLSTVQVALRQAQAKAPSQTQHFTASLSSHSPSQSLHASPGAQGGHKKARSEQTQLTPRQSVAAQDADTISAGRLSSGAAPQFSNDHAASQSGQLEAIHQFESQSKEDSGAEAEAEVSKAPAPRVGQARVVARGRGRGRGRGRQATKIGG